MEKIVLIGGGGHARSVMDTLIRCGKYEIIGYTDIQKTSIPLEYLGNDSILKGIKDSGIKNVAVGIGYLGKSNIRDELYKKIKLLGYELPVIVDPSAIISKFSNIEEGTFVGKNTVINSGTSIGKMCIINTGAIVEHTCCVGSFTHISVNATICGDASIGNHVLVGAHSTIIQGVGVGNDSVIGAGSVVINDIESNVIRYGVI